MRVAIDLDADADTAGKLDRERLRAAHAAQSGGHGDGAGQRAVEVLLRRGFEGLVGALQDALCADVDPGARGHLAVHHQACRIQPVEFLPVSPVRYQVRVRDEDTRRQAMCLHDANGLAGLDEKRLVISEAIQRLDDLVIALPIARRLAAAAIDDQFLRLLGNLGIEVVHQHPLGCFLDPAPRGFGVSAGCSNL